MGKGPGPQPSGKAGLSMETRGRGVGPASLEGQPLGAGLRGSTSLPGGTRPPGAGLHQLAERDSASGRRSRGSTSLPGGTHRPSAGHRDRPGAPSGLSLRARCSTSLPGGTELFGAGRRGRPACTAGLSLLARARGSTIRPGGTRPPCAGLHQPAERDSASGLGSRGSTSLPSGTERTGPSCGGRPSGPAVLSLHARGLWVRPSSTAGLIVRARATEINQAPWRE